MRAALWVPICLVGGCMLLNALPKSETTGTNDCSATPWHPSGANASAFVYGDLLGGISVCGGDAAWINRMQACVSHFTQERGETALWAIYQNAFAAERSKALAHPRTECVEMSGWKTKIETKLLRSGH